VLKALRHPKANTQKQRARLRNLALAWLRSGSGDAVLLYGIRS
jgi:hypothetical protein